MTTSLPAMGRVASISPRPLERPITSLWTAETAAVALSPLVMVGVPANNEFFSAQTITGLNGTLVACNFNATKDVGEPNHAGDPGGHSIWYQWESSQAGVANHQPGG
jgi:hypothetical protein